MLLQLSKETHIACHASPIGTHHNQKTSTQLPLRAGGPPGCTPPPARTGPGTDGRPTPERGLKGLVHHDDVAQLPLDHLVDAERSVRSLSGSRTVGRRPRFFGTTRAKREVPRLRHFLVQLRHHRVLKEARTRSKDRRPGFGGCGILCDPMCKARKIRKKLFEYRNLGPAGVGSFMSIDRPITGWSKACHVPTRRGSASSPLRKRTPCPRGGGWVALGMV